MPVDKFPKNLILLGHIVLFLSGVSEARGILCREGACHLRGRILTDTEPADSELLTWQPAAAPVTSQPLYKSPGSRGDVIDHAVMSIGGTTRFNPPPASPPPASPPLPRVGGGIRPVTPTPTSSNNCSNSNSPLINSYGLTKNCGRYSLSVGFILGGAGCLALVGLVSLGVACSSRQRRVARNSEEIPEALVKLEGPIVGFQVSVPGSTAMTQMAWVEPKAPPELEGDRFISPESTVHSANNYNASWHGPVFSGSGHLMSVGGVESLLALNVSELQSSGREGGEEEETHGGPLETRRVLRSGGEEEGGSGEAKV